MKNRLMVLLFVFSFLFLGLTGKAFYEQIIMGSNHVKRSLSIRTIDFPGEQYLRGDILDRNGISLTDTAVRPTIAVFPRLIADQGEIVSSIPGISIRDIEPYYRREVKIYPDNFLIHLDPDDVELIAKVQQLDNPGVAILPIKTRYGPNSLAEHIVGYIGYSANSTEQRGLKGIEGLYDSQLKGDKAERIITPVLDARNNVLTGLGYRNIELGLDSSRSDVVLTIDSRMQRIAQDALDNQGVVKGGVAVLDVTTGNIVAAVSRPAFDQNKPSQNPLGYNNQLERVIDYQAYPGSIFKVITAAAALEEGVVTPETRFNCLGYSEDFHVTCPRPHGELTFTDAMARSCNVTFVEVGLKLGRVKLEEYMLQKFGFTPVANKSLNSKSARANGIIGQEIFRISPLEVANMMATIARDGYHQPLINPWRTRLVQAIANDNETKMVATAPHFEQLYSSKTSNSLKDMLTATNQWGSGRSAWVENYGSAGKTGTPQSARSNEYLAWYAGYAPLQSPRYAVAVLIEEIDDLSRSNLQGGSFAGPIFKEIVENILALEH